MSKITLTLKGKPPVPPLSLRRRPIRGAGPRYRSLAGDQGESIALSEQQTREQPPENHGTQQSQGPGDEDPEGGTGGDEAADGGADGGARAPDGGARARDGGAGAGAPEPGGGGQAGGGHVARADGEGRGARGQGD